MSKYFPIIQWLSNYQRGHLSTDFFSGLTIGVMLIPQGMAYAMIVR
jgi:SulP family sulfate permease